MHYICRFLYLNASLYIFVLIIPCTQSIFGLNYFFALAIGSNPDDDRLLVEIRIQHIKTFGVIMNGIFFFSCILQDVWKLHIKH